MSQTPANEEMKDWGLYDVKWATPITLGDGATTIAVEFADARPWQSYDYSLTLRDNGDTTSTILATYKPSGCTIIIR